MSEFDEGAWWTAIGVVMIVGGVGDGFQQVRSTTITHDMAGLPGQSLEYEGFGLALAAGDVTGDGRLTWGFARRVPEATSKTASWATEPCTFYRDPQPD